MALLGRKTEDEKRDEAEAKERMKTINDAARASEDAAKAEQAARLREHLASIQTWQYQVKRVGEDKQKGLLGSQRMEQLFNAEGAQGWELVAINEERATFKRPLPRSR